MADLQVVLTGEFFWGVDDCLAKILLAAFPDRFVRMQKRSAAQVAPATSYAVVKLGSGLLCIKQTKGSTTHFISISPEQVKKHYPDCPDSVVAEWAATDWKARAQFGKMGS
jgi:hypothetical protein